MRLGEDLGMRLNGVDLRPLTSSLNSMPVAWHSETPTLVKIAMAEPIGTCRYEHTFQYSDMQHRKNYQWTQD